MQTEVNKLDYVDALRGIAVLGVILVHTSALTPNAVIRFAGRGALGVQLFFIASAFTLFRSMSSRIRREERPIRNFFIRRFFRIAPLFYLAMCVSLAVDGFAPRYFAPAGVHLRDVLTTALFVNGWQPDTINSIVIGEWSIAVEMTFYALLPILYVVLTSARRAFIAWYVAWILACCTAPLSLLLAGSRSPLYGDFDYFWFPGQLPVFISGLLLFFALHDRMRPIRFVALQAACLLSIGAAALANRHFSLHLHLHLTSTGAGICFSCFAFLLAKTDLTLFVNGVTRHIGKVSYSAYLSHPWVIRALIPLKPLLGHIPIRLQMPIAFCIVTALAVLISTFLHSFLEIPSQNAGKRLIRFLEEGRGDLLKRSEG